MENISLQYQTGDYVKFKHRYTIYGKPNIPKLCPNCKGYSNEMVFCQLCRGIGLIYLRETTEQEDIEQGKVTKAIVEMGEGWVDISYQIQTNLAHYTVKEIDIIGEGVEPSVEANTVRIFG